MSSLSWVPNMDRRLYTISTCRGATHRQRSVLEAVLGVCRSLAGQMAHFCSQVVCDSARHRVAWITGWFMVQSAASGLQGIKGNTNCKK